MSEKKETITMESAIVEYNTENLTMAAIKVFKDAEALECVDTESRKVLGKHRADIKSLNSAIEKKRLDNNRDYKEKNKKFADFLKETLCLSLGVFDKKIKAYDSIADEKRIAKAKIESDRLALINGYIRALEYDCSPLEYGLSSEKIAGEIRFLEEIEISAVDYSDRAEEAEQILNNALSFASANLESALKFESDQAAAVKLKADNEAAAKKLADDQAAFKAKQDKAEADQKAKDDAAKKLADEQAETTRKANKKLESDQKALDDEKAELAAEKYSAMVNDATAINMFIVNDSAVLENEYFDRDKAQDEEDKKAQLKKDKARAKLITQDKKTVQATINQIDKMVSEIKPFDYKTDEAAQVITDLYVRIKTALDDAKKAGVDLV